jgi:flagellar protein FlgJ
MTLPVENASVYTDLKGLAALRRDAKAQDPQAVREAARQFESLFARMMLKSMRAASFGDPLMGSDQQEFYQGMFDDKMAVEMTRGKGLGLADMLVQQLARAGLTPPGAADAQNPAAPPMKPNSILNPYAAANSTTPSQALAMVDKIAPVGAAAEIPANTWQPGEPEDFVRQLWPVAQQAGRDLGVDPRHILAQAALETGWGRAVPTDTEGRSSFNFFGVKAGGQWKGAAVSVRTLEFENGVAVPRRDRFRAYDSPQAAFNDYVALLKSNPRYAAALNTGGDAKAFATALQSAGYATDPAYARKIAAIAQNLDAAPPALKSADARPINSTPEL